MKKRFGKRLIVLIVAIAVMTAFAACASEQPSAGEDTLLEFTEIAFDDKTVVYDGHEHEIVLTGTLPEGADVKYTGNKGINAGTYDAQAVISNDGYNTLTLTAELVIEKADFTGITLEDKRIRYDGEAHSIEISGVLPEGAEVKYTGNSVTEAGTHIVKAEISGANYNTLTLTAELEIYTILDVASTIVANLTDRPDPWSFMPQSFAPENMAYDSVPAGGLESFAAFTDVSEIAVRPVGKQMNVLYEGLIDMTSVLSAADGVFSAGGLIAEIYQDFINDNPDDYAQFEGQVSGISFKIMLNGDESVMLAGNSSVSIRLDYNGETGERACRIQLSDGVALKYVADDTSLKFAYKATVNGAGLLKQIEFVRDGAAVTGYMREITGTGSAALKTTAVISSNAEKTIIMSDKRETDDMLINGYEEVYDSVTGEFIGGEVRENVKLIDYDTLWFMLCDVTGIETVRVEDAQNGLNADTVYVNGSSTPFKAKTVGGFTLRNPSRRYDIEMKEVWYVVRTAEGDDVSYQTVKTLIPMLCAQIPEYEDFSTDVAASNPGIFTVTPTLPAGDTNDIMADYEALQQTFLVIKEKVGYDEIVAFIGDNDDYFGQ